jgi:hypothetical protein
MRVGALSVRAVGAQKSSLRLVSSRQGLIRFALNLYGLGEIEWISIPNEPKSFINFSNLIQSIYDRNNQTRTKMDEPHW